MNRKLLVRLDADDCYLMGTSSWYKNLFTDTLLDHPWGNSVVSLEILEVRLRKIRRLCKDGVNLALALREGAQIFLKCSS